MRYRNTRSLSVLAARLVNGLVLLVDATASMFGLGSISRIHRAHPRQHEPQGCARFARLFPPTQPPSTSWRRSLALKARRSAFGVVPVVAMVGRGSSVSGHARVGRLGIGLG